MDLHSSRPIRFHDRAPHSRGNCHRRETPAAVARLYLSGDQSPALRIFSIEECVSNRNKVDSHTVGKLFLQHRYKNADSPVRIDMGQDHHLPVDQMRHKIISGRSRNHQISPGLSTACHCNRQNRVGTKRAITGSDGHIIDASIVKICGNVKIRRCGKGQRTGQRVNRKKRCISAPSESIARLIVIHVGHTNLHDSCGVFSMRQYLRQRPLRRRNSTDVGTAPGDASEMAGTRCAGGISTARKSAPLSGGKSPFFFRSWRQA